MVRATMYNDAQNGFGFNEPFRSEWNVESAPFSKVYQSGVAIGLIPSVLGFMLMFGDDPLANHYDLQLNLTLPSLVRPNTYGNLRSTNFGVSVEKAHGRGTEEAHVLKSWDYAPALWRSSILLNSDILFSRNRN